MTELQVWASLGFGVWALRSTTNVIHHQVAGTSSVPASCTRPRPSPLDFILQRTLDFARPTPRQLQHRAAQHRHLGRLFQRHLCNDRQRQPARQNRGRAQPSRAPAVCPTRFALGCRRAVCSLRLMFSPGCQVAVARPATRPRSTEQLPWRFKGYYCDA